MRNVATVLANLELIFLAPFGCRCGDAFLVFGFRSLRATLGMFKTTFCGAIDDGHDWRFGNADAIHVNKPIAAAFILFASTRAIVGWPHANTALIGRSLGAAHGSNDAIGGTFATNAILKRFPALAGWIH
jgi:hypothetical protein